MRLEPNTTKNGQARTFPFGVYPALRELLQAQRAYTDEVERETGTIVRWVFHRRSKRIKSYEGAWRAACRTAAGVETRGTLSVVARPHLVERIPHDLRRTACRNLIRAGVPEKTAMLLVGHETRDVFERYNITDDRDLADAVTKLAEHAARRRVARAGAKVISRYSAGQRAGRAS